MKQIQSTHTPLSAPDPPVVICHQHDNCQRKNSQVLLILKVSIRSYENIELSCCKSQKLAVFFT